MTHPLVVVLFESRDAKQIKEKVKRLKKTLQVHRYSSSAKKTKFEDLQTEVGVGVEGCLGHPQAYGLNHFWMNLDLVWLHSL